MIFATPPHDHAAFYIKTLSSALTLIYTTLRTRRALRHRATASLLRRLSRLLTDAVGRVASGLGAGRLIQRRELGRREGLWDGSAPLSGEDCTCCNYSFVMALREHDRGLEV